MAITVGPEKIPGPKTQNSGLILPAPQVFSGNWDDNAHRWIERFQRHVQSLKTKLNDDELMDYAQSFYKGRATIWHQSAAVLYESWDLYVSAFLVEFNPEKLRVFAKSKLNEVNLYKRDLLQSYAVITKVFRVLNVEDIDSRVNFLFKKLRKDHRELMIQLGIMTVHQIMDFLHSRQEKDKLYSRAVVENRVDRRDKGNKFDKQIQCYNCRNLGHMTKNCPYQ
ncbi:hypothetical protein BB561_006955, partial [Smittium simulii]